MKITPDQLTKIFDLAEAEIAAALGALHDRIRTAMTEADAPLSTLDRVFNVFNGKPLTVPQVAARTNHPYNAVSHVLARLVDEGRLVRLRRGVYCRPEVANG